jgi:hypothetical protein
MSSLLPCSCFACDRAFLQDCKKAISYFWSFFSRVHFGCAVSRVSARRAGSKKTSRRAGGQAAEEEEGRSAKTIFIEQQKQ